MTDDEFEWDDGKARANLKKHGVGFEDASLAFLDLFLIERDDRRLDYGEDRFLITGMVKGRLLSVAYTERNGLIRILSARPASKREQDDYYRNQTPE